MTSLHLTPSNLPTCSALNGCANWRTPSGGVNIWTPDLSPQSTTITTTAYCGFHRWIISSSVNCGNSFRIGPYFYALVDLQRLNDETRRSFSLLLLLLIRFEILAKSSSILATQGSLPLYVYIHVWLACLLTRLSLSIFPILCIVWYLCLCVCLSFNPPLCLSLPVCLHFIRYPFCMPPYFSVSLLVFLSLSPFYKLQF